MSKASQNQYQVLKFSSKSEFQELKEPWEKLYSEDSNAHLYVSWEWLNILFSASAVDWFILGVQDKESNKYIAFLQFTIEAKKFKRILNWHLVRLGAHPIGNYSGFLCKPGFNQVALEMAVTFFCKEISWDKLFLTNVRDPRVDYFLSAFSQKKYKVDINPNPVSTRILLPETWEVYLKESIGKQTRKTFVRLLNRTTENEDIQITSIERGTLSHYSDILFKLWQNKWGIQPNTEIEKKIFDQLFDLGMLQLNILWNKQTPIAAQGLILDSEKSTVFAFLTGYDPNYSKLSPGNIIGLYSIKDAISKGYKYYDFYQGADSYKLTFGAVKQYPTSAKITNKGFKTSLIDRLVLLLKKLK